MDASTVHPISPSFLVQSPDPETHLTSVIRAVLKARRIAVVCGAGISVEAGIPDFRSQDGLFQSLKRDNPKESLSSGKDLFDASVFKSKQKTVLFYRMIARLSSLSSQGLPTAFHQLLRVLDDRGQLLRVYTQNIDALEMKAGLSFGVPAFDEKKLRFKGKGKARDKAKESENGAYNARLGGRKGTQPLTELGPGPSTPPQRVTPAEPDPRLNVIPRCIPLHGTLLTLHCQHCTQSFPLRPPPPPPTTSSPPSPPNSSGDDAVVPASLHSMLAHGTPPPCPSCTSLEETRALVGKRLRGVGKLRPSVVLYGEDHREGEGVGEVVRRDLCGITDGKAATATATAAATPEKGDTPSKARVRAGKGPDLLLVVGTSLRVPGTKRIVREFSKAVRTPVVAQPAAAAGLQLPTPTSSPPAADRIPEKIRTVYVNFDFPLPAREWEGVFDVWVNGDVQAFAKAVDGVIKDEERRRGPVQVKVKPEKEGKGKGRMKRGNVESTTTPVRPAKRRKTGDMCVLPRTPTSLPRKYKSGPGRTKKRDPPSPSPSPRGIGIRRVILRLPKPPPPPMKRTLSIPEVVITRTKAQAQASVKKRAVSPWGSVASTLTSLSRLTPPPYYVPLPEPESGCAAGAEAVDVWRIDVDREGEKGVKEMDEDDEDEDVPLAVVMARRTGRSVIK